MSVIFYCVPVKQKDGEFYVSSINYKDLLRVVKPDPRRWDEDNSDKLVGVQREINPKRVKQISKYVTYDFATFPTSVVVSFDERFVSITELKSCEGLVRMEINLDYFDEDGGKKFKIENAGYIIDGQHRLSALAQAQNEIDDFQLNVSIFVGIDIATRAEIFSTVNLTQSKVNKSLGYDLFSYQLPPSPYRTAHDVVVALDKKEDSPFYQRIKRLGVTTPDRKKKQERVSQATIVRGLLKYLTANPDLERHKGIRGKQAEREPRENDTVRILAPFYRQNSTVEILQNYLNYFRAVRDKWPIAWDDEDNEYMLCSTNGFNGLNSFFRDAYLHFNDTPQSPTVILKSQFTSIFQNFDINYDDFDTSNYSAGSSGASKLYRDLKYQFRKSL